MTRLQWHRPGESKFQTGVDRGVLFVRDTDGTYQDGVPWNGLTTVTESPSGAESNKQYADNKVYVNLKSAEEFAATIEAFWSPKEFDQCDGSAEVVPGVYFGQQRRKSFGFSWCSLIGDELEGTDRGRRMHFAYGCDAAPSERANATVNDSPEAAGLSWDVSTNPVNVGTVNGVEYKPVAHVYVDSTEVTDAVWTSLEDIVYGSAGNEPRLPMPGEIAALVSGGTVVNLALPANQPTYNAGTYVITLPATTGVQWKVNGVNKAAGAQPPLGAGESATVTAHPASSGYVLKGDDDWTFARP